MSRFIALLIAAVSLSLSIGLVIGQNSTPAGAAPTNLSVLQSINAKLAKANTRLSRLGPIRDRINQMKAALTKRNVLTYKGRGLAQVMAGATLPGATLTADAYVARFGTNTGAARSATGTPCTVGEIRLTASPAVTAGGVPANGQILEINTNPNQALFAVLGTTYGGDGRTTFALPDLRAITPNNMTYSICVSGTFPSG